MASEAQSVGQEQMSVPCKVAVGRLASIHFLQLVHCVRDGVKYVRQALRLLQKKVPLTNPPTPCVIDRPLIEEEEVGYVEMRRVVSFSLWSS